MIRKRTVIIVITILLLLAGSLSYLQWGRQMDVSSSSASGSDNHYELRVSVILNTLVVTDQQKCVEQIFEKCRDNSFHSVRFSYDIQIPHAHFLLRSTRTRKTLNPATRHLAFPISRKTR